MAEKFMMSVEDSEELAWRGVGSEWHLDDLGRTVKLVHKEIIDQGRWSTFHQIVFELDGELYGFVFEEASTEMQEVYREDVECVPHVAVPSVRYEPAGEA